MTGTPKSLRAVVLSCWHCTHPDLDGTDKSLLAYLAFYSSGTSGGNAYPGNRNIADALGLTDTPTDLRLKKNIERGLIERTASAVGRKKASVYRLRLESPYFPDKTAGGERLVTDMPEDETNPGGETPYPHRAKSGKRPPQGVKTPYEEAENAPPGQATNKDVSNPHQENSSSNNPLGRAKAAQPRGVSCAKNAQLHACLDESLAYPSPEGQRQRLRDLLWGRLPTLRNARPATNPHLDAALAAIDRYDEDVFLLALEQWCLQMAKEDYKPLECGSDEDGDPMYKSYLLDAFLKDGLAKYAEFVRPYVGLLSGNALTFAARLRNGDEWMDYVPDEAEAKRLQTLGRQYTLQELSEGLAFEGGNIVSFLAFAEQAIYHSKTRGRRNRTRGPQQRAKLKQLAKQGYTWQQILRAYELAGRNIWRFIRHAENYLFEAEAESEPW